MAEYKWDREELMQCAQKLDKVASTLEHENGLLTNSVIELSEEWKGAAGGAYLRVAGENEQDILDLIAKIKAVSEILKKIADQIYKDCENRILSSIQKIMY